MASDSESSADYHSAEEQDLADEISRVTIDNKMGECHKEKAAFVSNLDNRYVSENVDEVKGEKIELSEEQIKV